MTIVLIWILFAIFSALIASNKGRSIANWFLAGLLFGPFGLIVGFLSNIKNEEQNNSSYIQDLKALSDLKDSGVMNKDEFIKRKSIIDKKDIQSKSAKEDANSSLVGYIIILIIVIVIYYAIK